MAARKAASRMPARMKRPMTAVHGGAELTPVTGGAASPGGTPQEMPLQQVTVSYDGGPYVTLGSSELVPLVTADGAAVPATAPGRWGQLRQAGRP